MNLQFHLDHPLLFAVSLLALGAWTLWIYGRTRPRPGLSARRLLMLSRLAASLLLSLMLGGWSLEWTRTRREAPILRVLVDASASMSLPAGSADSTSRYDEALGIVQALEKEDGFQLRSAAFGGMLLAGPLPESPIASFTDLGAALRALPAPRPGETALVLSDGRDRGDALWAGQPRRPVLAVMLGDSLPRPDLRLGVPEAPALLQRGERGKLSVEVQSLQGAPKNGRLRLSEGGELLEEKDWNMVDEPGRLTMELPLSFERVGSHRLTLVLEGEGEDAVPQNDRREFQIEVLDDKLEILVLAGRPDWDLPFLLDALRSEKGLSLQLVTCGPDGEAREARTGKAWTEPGKRIDGLVLHSLAPSWSVKLDSLDAGGLFLFPGALASPDLPASWGMDLAAGSREDGDFPLRWSPGAFRHEALGALRATAGTSSDLPRLESLRPLKIAGLRPFLESEGRPVLGARVWNGHRQAILSGSGLYRMALAGKEGRERLGSLYSGLIRWLSRQSPPERIRLLPPDRARRSGRPLPLRADLYDSDYRRLEGGRLGWDLHDGAKAIGSGSFLPPLRGGDDFSATLPTLPAGDYELTLRADFDDGETLERKLEFPVLSDAGEFARPEASPAPLRWLADRSGGRFFPDGDLSALDAALPRESTQSVRQVRLRLWDHPLFFLLFLALLALEWGLRKRHGLV